MSVIVAAAGSWCTGMKIEALQPGIYTQLTYSLHALVAFVHRSLMLSLITQPVLADLKESSSNCVWSSLQPDPEELCAFTDLYGPLRLLLSFQVHPFSVTLDPPDFCTQENKKAVDNKRSSISPPCKDEACCMCRPRLVFSGRGIPPHLQPG